MKGFLRRIYVAGPISPTKTGGAGALEFLANINRGVSASVDVMKHGMAPFSPFLDFLYFIKAGVPLGDEYVEKIRAVSMSFLSTCHAALVLSPYLHSSGTKEEIATANRLNIPVFFNLANLLIYFSTVDKSPEVGTLRPKPPTPPGLSDLAKEPMSWNEVKGLGSEHYKTGATEPIDLLRDGRLLRDFALGNIIKYAYRNRGQNRPFQPKDMDKIIHYAKILLAALGPQKESSMGGVQPERGDTLVSNLGKAHSKWDIRTPTKEELREMLDDRYNG